jgi:hypothetical protein
MNCGYTFTTQMSQQRHEGQTLHQFVCVCVCVCVCTVKPKIIKKRQPTKKNSFRTCDRTSRSRGEHYFFRTEESQVQISFGDWLVADRQREEVRSV